MFRLTILLTLLLGTKAFTQISQLRIYPNINDNDSCFSIYVLKDIDTVYSEDFNVDTNISLDSLVDGLYKIVIYSNKRQDSPYLTKYVSLLPNKIAFVHLNLSTEEQYTDYDPKSRNEKTHERAEAQFTLGYFDNRWIEKHPRIQNNYSLGVTLYYWGPFTKHFGFLGGVGVGVSQHYFSKDTSTTPVVPKANYERYTNIKLNLEAKFRISTGNQQTYGPHFGQHFVIDIGAGYYFPIMFRHVSNYNDNTKVINMFIHQYTDVRAFINIGYYPVTVFAEYRLSDFLLGNYPELPLYNVGLRFLFGG